MILNSNIISNSELTIGYLSSFIPELIIVGIIVFGIVLDLIPKTKCYVKYFSIIGLAVALIYKFLTLGSENIAIFYD